VAALGIRPFAGRLTPWKGYNPLVIVATEQREDVAMTNTKVEIAEEALPEERSLLIVDDDEPFRTRLATAMERRGFVVSTAESVEAGISAATAAAPAYAVVDLKLGEDNGLEMVHALQRVSPDARVVMLTGYGNIATAVAAVKAGAVDYLSKPVDPDRLAATLLQWNGDEAPLPEPSEMPMTPERVRWEHIQRIYDESGRNVSETARRLRMHRRTLQRILAKHAPPE
jgi:two-component system response regulator RegA